MSDINTFINAIKTAVRGRDVRDAIVSAISQCYHDHAQGLMPRVSLNEYFDRTEVTITVGTEKTTFSVINGSATDEQVRQYVSEYISDNPHLVTTIQNNEITMNMLNEEVSSLIMMSEDFRVRYSDITLVTEERENRTYLKIAAGGEQLAEVEIHDIREGGVTLQMLSAQVQDKLSNLESKSSLQNLVLETVELEGKSYLIAKDGTEEITRVEIIGSGGLSFNSGYMSEDGYMHLTKDGEDIQGFDPFFIGGGGGGGSSSGSKLVFALTTPTSFSVLDTSEQANITFRFKSTEIETGASTGNGNVQVQVNGINRENITMQQGNECSVDVFRYLSLGNNTIKLTLTDSYGATATRTITVTLDTFNLEWTLENTVKNSGTLSFYITPTGSGAKTIYVLVDGQLYTSQQTNTTGRRLSFNVTLTEGYHLIEAYGEMESAGSMLNTDRLTCAVAQVNEGSSTIVVVGNYPQTEAKQYETISIPYRVVNPLETPTTVTFKIDGIVYRTERVDQTEHVFSYRLTNTGVTRIEIASGTASWVKEISTGGLDVDVEEITENLILKVDASSISDLDSFNYNGVRLIKSEGFDEENGGIVTDNENTRCIRIMKGDRLTVSHKLFGTDARRNGMNFKFIYKVENSTNFNANAIQCLNNNVGLSIRANDITVSSEQSAINLHTCEGFKTEIECNIEPDSANRLMMLWEKGTPTKASIYASNDNFSQISASDIVIGSDDCDVYLYLIRAYSRDLTRTEIKSNYFVDGKDALEIKERFDRNQVYDITGRLDPNLVAEKNPHMHVITWHASNISTGKKQKITGTVTHKFVNGGARHEWSASGVVQKAQGTSSLGYVNAGCNEDFEFANGFDLADGTHIDKYAMTDESIGVNYFNFKTNVASQEHINNILVNEWHNQHQPYVRPAKQQNSKVRDTVEGHIAAFFFHNTGNERVQVGPYQVEPNETIFYSLGCLNNSKKNTEVFAQDDNDDIFTIEIRNNINPQCRFKSADLTGEEWEGDQSFEFRHLADSIPQEDAQNKWKEFLEWVVSCDADNATNAQLPEPAIFSGQRFTTDSASYRKAKWKHEAPEKMIMDSVLYHQIITLVLSQVDNRCKNAFWTYSKLQNKWHMAFAYDNDTAMGNDNEGGLTLKYGYLDTDRLGTRDVFNGADNTVFCMNRYVFEDELREMFIRCENTGAWNLEALANRCDEEQSKACESLWIDDVYRKCIDTLINLGDSAYIPMLNGKKRLQRRQFLQFQQQFMTSYFRSPYSNSKSATIRGYSPDEASGASPKLEMTITPYCDMFVTVQTGSLISQERALANQPVTLSLGNAKLNDTEIYIRNSDYIQDLGALYDLYPGYTDLSNCARLRRAEIGKSDEAYENTNFKDLNLSNAVSLEYLNLEGCTALENKELNLSNNVNVKECYTRRTKLTGVTFANRGRLETALLNSITSIYANGLNRVKQFSLADYTNLSTMNITDSAIDTLEILRNAPNLQRVRLIEVNWNTTVKAYDFIKRIHSIGGIDDDGHNTLNGVLTGTVFFNSISPAKYRDLVDTFPKVEFSFGEELSEYTVQFINDDGTVLNTQKVEHAGSAIDPIANGLIETPTKAPDVEHVYEFYGWNMLFDTIIQDVSITAVYSAKTRYYTVEFLNYAGEVVHRVENVEPHGSVEYNGDDLIENGRIWTGWSEATNDVVSDMKIRATYINPQLPTSVKDLSIYDYAYSDNSLDNSAYTFEELYAIIKTGRTSEFLPVTTKIKMTLNSDAITDEELVFNVHSIGHYELCDGSGMSHADFYMNGVLNANRQMNTQNTNVGGWDASKLRAWMNETLYKTFDYKWRSLIAKSNSLASAGNMSSNIITSQDCLRIPAFSEMGFDLNSVPYKNEISERAQEKVFNQYTDNNSRIKRTFNGEGSAQNYWTRSANAGSSTYFMCVHNYGGSINNFAANSCGVCVGFSA